MKKLIGIFLVIIISLFGFAACSGGNRNENESVGDNAGIGGSGETGGSVTETEIPDKEIAGMYITINENKLEVELAENSSADALVELLKKGDITYTADDYGGFEKVGDIGHTLPQNNTQITTQAGDVILYQGRSICIYYGVNSWNFTRIGKINGYTESELRMLLGAGEGTVGVKISLN